MENPYIRALFWIFLTIALILIISCATKKPECTFVCADPHDIPGSCACAEEMMGEK
jgi:hypothetical protein